MELKLFADLIDALGKVVGGLKALVSLPKAEREKYRRTMDETYRLIDTTLNMVIIRLGDVLLLDAPADFLREAARLDNYGEWMQAEREFRLCRSLRVALRETETLSGQLAGAISARDWEALLQQMQAILATEGEVASFIGQQFHALASTARNAAPDAQTPDAVRNQIAAFREALLKERHQLIQQEMELYAVV